MKRLAKIALAAVVAIGGIGFHRLAGFPNARFWRKF